MPANHTDNPQTADQVLRLNRSQQLTLLAKVVGLTMRTALRHIGDGIGWAGLDGSPRDRETTRWGS